jgi:hypothetical protein
MKLIGEAGHRRVIARDGQPVLAYPEQLRFRVTASGRVKLFVDGTRQDVRLTDLETTLRTLKFRLKIFNGLQVHTLEPASVRMIGVPADVPYDERVYQVSFNIGSVPIDRRIVLEVLDSTDARLCKFHLEFN